MGQGPSGWSGMGRETHPVVRDKSGDPQGDSGWVGGNSGKSRTGRGTFRRFGTGLENLGVVRVGSEEPSGWSRTSRGTHPEVRDESRDPPGGLGWVGGPSGKSVTCRGTLPEV